MSLQYCSPVVHSSVCTFPIRSLGLTFVWSLLKNYNHPCMDRISPFNSFYYWYCFLMLIRSRLSQYTVIYNFCFRLQQRMLVIRLLIYFRSPQYIQVGKNIHLHFFFKVILQLKLEIAYQCFLVLIRSRLSSVTQYYISWTLDVMEGVVYVTYISGKDS